MVKITVSVFALLAALASAYTQPDLSVSPSGNPIITPATGSTVDAGKSFDITWTATSKGTVTIYLCKGPSSNCENQTPPLADHATNSGKFSWAVSTSLPPSTTKGEGYGIMIVDDADNKIYQWSGQFGISNPSYSGSSASASASASASGSGKGASSYSASATSSASAQSSVYVSATGGYNSTVVQPTKTPSVPATLKSTVVATTAAGTASSSPTSTGAAGMVQVGFGAVFGGIVAALAL